MANIKLRGTPAMGMWGATLGFFFGMSAVSLFGPSAARFKEVMDLDPTMVGLLVAIPSLSGSLLRIPFGAWVDTTGGKKPFMILMVLAVIGIAGLMWLVNSHYPDHMAGLYPLILLFGLLTGCGVATFSVGIGQTSYWYPQNKQGFALGTYGGVGTLAPGLFALLIPIYIQHFGFASSYVVWTIFLAVGTALYWLIGRNAYFFQYRKAGLPVPDSIAQAKAKGQELFPKGSVKQSLVDSAKVPATWYLTILYFASFGGFLALTEWYPSFWHQFYKVSAIEAGVLTATFSMLSAIVRVFAGPLADKLGGVKLCMFSMILLFGSALAMGLVSSFGLSLLCTILIAVAMGVNDTAVFKLAPLYIPKAIGGASGWIGGVGAFGGFVIPPVMGAIATKYGHMGYAWGFEVFVLLAAINIAVLYFGLMRKNKKGNTPAEDASPTVK